MSLPKITMRKLVRERRKSGLHVMTAGGLVPYEHYAKDGFEKVECAHQQALMEERGRTRYLVEQIRLRTKQVRRLQTQVYNLKCRLSEANKLKQKVAGQQTLIREALEIIKELRESR